MKKRFIFLLLPFLLFSGCSSSEKDFQSFEPPQSSVNQSQSIETIQKEGTQAETHPQKTQVNKKKDLSASREIYTVILFNGGEKGGFESEVHLVDKNSKTDQVIYKDDQRALDIYAIPEGKDSSKVILTSYLPDSDNPSASIFALDISKNPAQFQSFSFSDDMPFDFSKATLLSPNQTMLAAAHDRITEEADYKKKKLVIYDFIKGAQKTFDPLDHHEYFSRFNGDGVFSGTDEYGLKWISDTCVEAQIFIDDPEKIKSGEDLTEKVYKETRNYCL